MLPNDPAYPTKYYVPCVDPKAGFVECDGPGLTIRQRFAMAAMQGLLASCATAMSSPYTLAPDAVMCADALIAALKEGEKHDTGNP